MLKQLSGMDSMFLYAESHRAPLEVGALQIYDPSTAPDGLVRFKELLATFQNALDRCVMLRQRLVEVPFALDHPYWVDDESFDLEYHVRHISLPRPGDWPQLMAQIARLQARQLDHSKPLWIAHVIEGLNIQGLPPGCFAMFMKMHHSAIDGVTGQNVQAALHDLEPRQADASKYTPSIGLGEKADPGALSLLARTPLNTALKSTRLGFGIVRALPGLLRARLFSGDAMSPEVPMTPINNGRVSPNRVIDGCFFDLDDFKAIRATQAGVKVNDVALAVIGGALRYYLEAKDELPEASLVAGCPINVGTRADAEAGRGNLLSLMTPQLHTDVENPVERLRAVHQSTVTAKKLVQTMGARTLTEIPMNMPAPIARNIYPLLSTLALRAEMLPFNTMITNVIVQPPELYLAGARLVRVLATGPVIDQSGLFHTVFSFDGEISVGFTACRKMLPDPGFYIDCLEQSFDDLRNDSLGASAGTRRRKHRPKQTAKKATRKPAKKVGKKGAKKTAGSSGRSGRRTNGASA
jgi:WS/DGAT/MGAT family acyltransferase